MQNKNKHSIKCNKRDKLAFMGSVYVVRTLDNDVLGCFSTKYQAFECVSKSRYYFEEVSIVKVTEELVLS